MLSAKSAAASSLPASGLVQLGLRHFQRFTGGTCGAAAHVGFCRIQGSIVSRISDKALTELRIARAYIKLLCIPEASSEKSVSLACIGNCEIRIFEGSQVTSDGMPLFWLELFDRETKMSIDSFSCHEIKDALVVFEDFISQAGQLKEASGPAGGGTQD